MARPRTVFGWLMAVTLALAAVLAVTGVLLATVYQPATGQAELAYSDIEVRSPEVPWGALVRDMHEDASWLLSGLLLVLLVERVVAVARGLRGRSLAAAGALWVTTLALAFTGSLLPWEAKLLYGDSAVFIVDGVEVGAGTMRWWFYLHVVVLFALWAALYLVTARSARADQR